MGDSNLCKKKFIYEQLISCCVMKRGIILLVLICLILPSVSGQGTTAILTSDNPADFAVASAWSQKTGSHLVTTPWGEFSSGALSEVLSTGANLVYIIGGETAIPGAESILKKQGISVVQVSGADRAETSLKVAERFGGTRAVAVYGYDLTAMDDALTLASAETLPIVFYGSADAGFGKSLARMGIGQLELIESPAFDTVVSDSIKASGITTSEISRDEKATVETMLDLAQTRIDEAEVLVRSIKDAETLAAADLIVDAKIKMADAESSFKVGKYSEAFKGAVAAEESARYAIAVYTNRAQGRITDMIAIADLGIAQKGVSGVKEDLRDVGAPYGVGIPVPPIIDLSTYLTDIAGYNLSVEQGSGLGFDYDIIGKYTKAVGQTVTVEIYEQASEADAVEWAGLTKYSDEQSRDWENTTFMGYPASNKSITVPVSDNINQEIFLRVAVGKLGIFTKFTQSVRKSDADTLLLHPLVAQEMVEQVTGEVIKEIEASQ